MYFSHYTRTFMFIFMYKVDKQKKKCDKNMQSFSWNSNFANFSPLNIQVSTKIDFETQNPKCKQQKQQQQQHQQQNTENLGFHLLTDIFC